MGVPKALHSPSRRLEPILRYAFTSPSICGISTEGLHSESSIRRRIEVWTTSCIVTRFGRHLHTPIVAPSDQVMPDDSGDKRKGNVKWILVNPSNPGLTGCRKFPYFPRGGPVPEETVTSAVHKDWQPLGYVSQWGGMDVGSGMMYAVSVVDGLVHQTGGWKLQAELEWIRLRCNTDEACPIGSAITTSAGNGKLALNYDTIVHTTPPFFKHTANPDSGLVRCYESVLEQAFNATSPTMLESFFFQNPNDHVPYGINVAVPLLGSGARGFPVPEACGYASRALASWLQSPVQRISNGDKLYRQRGGDHVVAFGVLNVSTADTLAATFAADLGMRHIASA